MRRYKAFAGQIVDIADDACGCGSAITHVLIRPVEPERWKERGEMSILARGYCDVCSPAIDHSSVAVSIAERRAMTPVRPAGWLERLVRALMGREGARHATS